MASRRRCVASRFWNSSRCCCVKPSIGGACGSNDPDCDDSGAPTCGGRAYWEASEEVPISCVDGKGSPSSSCCNVSDSRDEILSVGEWLRGGDGEGAHGVAGGRLDGRLATVADADGRPLSHPGPPGSGSGLPRKARSLSSTWSSRPNNSVTVVTFSLCLE